MGTREIAGHLSPRLLPWSHGLPTNDEIALFPYTSPKTAKRCPIFPHCKDAANARQAPRGTANVNQSSPQVEFRNYPYAGASWFQV